MIEATAATLYHFLSVTVRSDSGPQLGETLLTEQVETIDADRCFEWLLGLSLIG